MMSRTGSRADASRRLRRVVVVLILLVVGVVLVTYVQSCGDTPVDEAAEPLSDSDALKAVREAQQSAGSSGVTVRVAEGVVTLTGTVDTTTDSAVAGAVARVAAGESFTIENRLEPRSSDAPDSTGRQPATDTQLEVQHEISSLLARTPIVFTSGSDTIADESDATLRAAAAILLANDMNVLIAGHTDADGEEGSNLELSRSRATAVLNRLVGLGVPAARLNSTGFGEQDPVADNETPAGKAANRRIEMLLLPSP